MEIKIGQKLFVKESFRIFVDAIYNHKPDEVGIVEFIDNRELRYPVCLIFVDVREVYSYEEIEKYFYNLAEWRDKQINSILDGD